MSDFEKLGTVGAFLCLGVIGVYAFKHNVNIGTGDGSVTVGAGGSGNRPPATAAPHITEAGHPSGAEHTVVAHDTWWKILGDFGLTGAEIQNCVNKHDLAHKSLHPGEVVTNPCG